MILLLLVACSGSLTEIVVTTPEGGAYTLGVPDWVCLGLFILLAATVSSRAATRASS